MALSSSLKNLLTRLENEDNDPSFVTIPELQAHASTEASFRVHTGKVIRRKADAPIQMHDQFVLARAMQGRKRAADHRAEGSLGIRPSALARL